MRILSVLSSISLPDAFKILAAVGISVFTMIIAVLISFMLIRWLFNHYRKSLTVQRWLLLENQGNTNSYFQMKVNSRQQRVKFSLLHQGSPLSNVEYVVEEPIVQEKNPSPAPKPAASAISQEKIEQKQEKSKKSLDGYKKAKGKSKAVVGFGRQIGALLGSLGGFIPGSLGNSLKEQASLLQNTTQKANEAIDTPDIKKREAENIKNQMAGLAKKGKDTPITGKPASAETQAQQGAQSTPTAQPETSPFPSKEATATRTISSKIRKVKSDFSKTPLVKPGETVKLQMKIDPVNIYRSGIIEYEVICQQVNEPDQNNAELVNRTQITDQLEIKGKSLGYAFLNFACSLIIVGLNALWVILALKWLFSLLFVG